MNVTSLRTDPLYHTTWVCVNTVIMGRLGSKVGQFIRDFCPQRNVEKYWMEWNVSLDFILVWSLVNLWMVYSFFMQNIQEMFDYQHITHKKNSKKVVFPCWNLNSYVKYFEIRDVWERKNDEFGHLLQEGCMEEGTPINSIYLTWCDFHLYFIKTTTNIRNEILEKID